MAAAPQTPTVPEVKREVKHEANSVLENTEEVLDELVNENGTLSAKDGVSTDIVADTTESNMRYGTSFDIYCLRSVAKLQLRI
jgi:hypothetical protein